jgi:serine/threonine-protein kinase HipA
MTSPDLGRLTSLWVFYLGDPAEPRLAGTVSLAPALNRCQFEYAEEWRKSGFSLSPDMPLSRQGSLLAPQGLTMPAALDDAMPDRWGQNMIRLVERPKRLTPLDFLYFAGDRRFGALGISTEPARHQPYADGPLLSSESLEEANEIIHRVIEKQPLNERERNLLRTSKSMGGAHPKMLIEISGEEWLAKFPKDDPVDLPLVEYATMQLARRAGIAIPEAKVHRIRFGHILLMKRFDRASGRRLHALSARTLLIGQGNESYTGLADVIRKHASARTIDAQRHELFRRMTFNILVDNTDDHSKNHAFLRAEGGHYELAPAYDLLPQMSGLGRQAIPIVPGSGEDDFDTAIRAARYFGMTEAGAIEVWREVSAVAGSWKEVFSAEGISAGDIEYLSDFIDADDKLRLRAS